MDEAVPSRAYDILALNLDLALDFPDRSVGGTAKYTIQQFRAGDFILDQVDLDIQSVTVDGEEVPWRTPGNTLVINIPDRIQPQGQAEVAIAYEATPRSGMHFRDVGRGSPDAYPEVWTQGQKNDNRYWFPAWDHPNDRFDYTGNITGPAGWKIMTNSGTNLPAYLVMVAGGPYQELGGPENRVWVGPKTSRKAMERVWSSVPDMLSHFHERTGLEYPWDGYTQVFVQRFMYGGMENTSATINTDNVITDADVDLTRDWIQSLIAHELAHQWYGDWLTCRSWRDLWLNEGFASFFGDDWMAHRDGPERWAYEVLRYFKWSQTEKPLAGRFFHGEDAAANHNVYSKGASVLQMLRVMLGEDVFWAGIRDYTQSNPKSLVRTIDLQSAMERASGRELDWFFQQWVELPHVPRLTVSREWSEGTLTVTVRQAVSDDRPAYTVPFAIEVPGAVGDGLYRGVLKDQKVQLHVKVEQEPSYVAFDPEAGILADLDDTQEPEAWAAQLNSEYPAAVFRALTALSETELSDPISLVLGDTGRHYLIREAAAQALGRQRNVDAVRPFAADRHDRVRKAAVRALGNGLDGRDLPLLERRLRSDPNADVRVEALWAIAQLAPARSAQLARRLLSGSDVDLARASTSILGDHGRLSDVDILVSFKVRKKTRTGGLRKAAELIRSAEAGPAQDAAMAKMTTVLIGMLDDLDLRARQTAVSLLRSVGDRRAIPHLEAFRRVETVASIAKNARSAVEDIRSRQNKVEPLAAENKHEAQMKDLESRIEELEKRIQAYEDKH